MNDTRLMPDGTNVTRVTTRLKQFGLCPHVGVRYTDPSGVVFLAWFPLDLWLLLPRKDN